MILDKEVALKDILGNLREENLAVFAGAGMSVGVGYVDWAGLLTPIAEELGLDIEKERDLVSLAQYHHNKFLSRSKINQVLIEEFSRDVQISENHKILARLPIDVFWTTNYDKLIEKSLEEIGKRPDVKYTINQLATTKPRRDAVVFKMHGDADHPDKAVLTRDDYESYHIKMQPFLSALSGDLVSKTFLFIGFSFTDPNLDYILSRVRTTYSDHQRRHYCFLKKVARKDGEELADFQYRERKQEFFIEDLGRFNIVTILIEDFSEITAFLRKLEKFYWRDCVFISGAAYEYEPWGKERSEKFIYELSKNLIRNGFKIVSGVGSGLGNTVISGALEEIYSDPGAFSQDQLILRPFPHKVYEEQEKTRFWYKYRQEMISNAGVALFLFGNKQKDGQLSLSDGMRDEFEIAKEKGLILLPIGVTGYISEELYSEVYSNFERFYPEIPPNVKDRFRMLNDKETQPEELVNVVIEILKVLTKGVQ